MKMENNKEIDTPLNWKKKKEKKIFSLIAKEIINVLSDVSKQDKKKIQNLGL